MVTKAEASLCPRCKNPGKETFVRKVRESDTRLYTYTCETEVCPWFETGWAVQIDADGNVYERPRGERGMDKTFQPLSDDAMSRGMRAIEDMKGRDLRPGEEIPNPFN